MPEKTYPAGRTAASAGVHALVALIVSVLVARGIDMPAGWSALVETALLAVVVAGYAGLTHWLASRAGHGQWSQAARLAAKVLTLGAGALVPAPPHVPAAAQRLREHAAAHRTANHRTNAGGAGPTKGAKT